MRPVMRPSIEVRLRRLFFSLWEVGPGDTAIVALVLGSVLSPANLTTFHLAATQAAYACRRGLRPKIVLMPTLGRVKVRGRIPHLLRKQIADADGESPGQRGYWQGVRGGPTPDRHTPGTHRHLRARHARAHHGHARAPHGHARADTRSRMHQLVFTNAIPPAGGPREPSPNCSADRGAQKTEKREDEQKKNQTQKNSGRKNSVTTEGRLLVATPRAGHAPQRTKHREKKNREEHSVIVMFPHISMPVRSTIVMRTFN